MFLNQVRFVSSGAGLLGVYALDRRKQTGSKTENPEPIFCPCQISVSENPVEFPKLQNVSNHLNLVECSNSGTDSNDDSLEDQVRYRFFTWGRWTPKDPAV
jgi:hypothetical protein